MKILSLLLFSFLGNANFLCGQTINPKDVIVSTNIPDNAVGRYNIGFEYFLKDKKKGIENSKFSIGLNGGFLSTVNKSQSLKGFDFIIETNWYTDLTLPKKWNEYGGLKVGYGNYNNETLNEKNNSYFIGIATGVQPIILKKIALKLNGDIGYMKNGLATTSFFSSEDEIFYSGFTVNFNVGIGVRF